MVKNYWTFFYFTLIGMIICISLFVIGIIFAKKIFLDKKYGVILLIISSCITFTFGAWFVSKFTSCCKDYNYVSNNTYIEEKAKVVEFTVYHFDDVNGRQENRRPKFYLIDKDEYIVLNAHKVELGELYIVRFYPNTKICEVVGRCN